jgi:RNA polymerase sigma-70 factor, ECF subfamily
MRISVEVMLEQSGCVCSQSDGAGLQTAEPKTGFSTLEIVAYVEGFRGYLLKCARRHWRNDVCRKMGESDLVQLALIRGIEHFHDFHGKSKAEFASWLRQILRRLISTHRRKLRSQKADIGREISIEQTQIVDQAPTALQRVINDELKQHVRNAMASLPEHYREIVELHQFDKLPFKEIGSQLHKSPEAVRKLWSRALSQLQHELESELDSELPLVAKPMQE